MGIAVDSQENLYLTDPDDARIRKISINTLFGATTPAAPITHTLDVHLAANETVTPSITFTAGNPDFAQSGAPACAKNGDNTVDCLINVAFQPSMPGTDSSAMLVTGTTTSGGIGLSGTGTMPAVSIDPGTTSLVSASLSATAQQVAVDGGGNLYVADTGNNQVLYFPANGSRRQRSRGLRDRRIQRRQRSRHLRQTARAPRSRGRYRRNLYIADTGNNVIRRVDRGTQIITTFAGGAASVCPLATDAFGDGCAAAQTIFAAPAGVAADANGNIYVSDTGHNEVRMIAANGYSTVYRRRRRTLWRDHRHLRRWLPRRRSPSSRHPPALLSIQRAISTSPIPATTSRAASTPSPASSLQSQAMARQAQPATAALQPARN